MRSAIVSFPCQCFLPVICGLLSISGPDDLANGRDLSRHACISPHIEGEHAVEQ